MEILKTRTILGAEVLQPMSGIGALSDSDTDAEYHEHEILGFTVQIIAEEVNRRPEKTDAVMWGIRAQLQRIVEVIPDDKLKLLQQVEIWINDDGDPEDEDDICPWTCYIPERYRSRDDFYEDRDGDVIIRQMQPLIDNAWCCTHSTVLHEMSHAYHDQFIEDGFYNDEIEDAYEDAEDSGDYDNNRVMYPWWEDQRAEHYGMTDQFEFFATMSVTFFVGYFRYPYNLRDLYELDRDTYDLILQAWYSDIEDGEVPLPVVPNQLEMSSQMPQP